jgi:tetratricopeptide (TPR) repeat protein
MDLELGKKFIEKKHFKKALIFFLNELKKGNNTVNTYFFLGLVCFELNNIKDSINYYKLALKISPKSINIILNLANAYLVSGSFLSAKNLYLKVIKLNKLESRGYYGLYLINPQFITEYTQNLNEIKNNHLNSDFLVEYLLSKIAKQNNNQDLELQYLNRFQEKCFKSKYEHNQQGLFYYNKIISKHYNKINFDNVESKDENLSNLSPIFIIGLPRSGSTLIETMISNAKHNVISLGETSIFNTEIINLIKDQIFKENFNSENELLNIDIKKLKQNILHRYEDYFSKNEKNLFFVDKSLENFFNIEIILKIFPNAKFINCKRNYNDNAMRFISQCYQTCPGHI